MGQVTPVGVLMAMGLSLFSAQALAWPYAIRDSQEEQLRVAQPTSAAPRLPPRAIKVEARPFTIGVVLARTGPWADIGNDIAQGIALAAEHANGMAAGRILRFVHADSRAKPKEAVERAQQLIAEHGVELLIGPVTSPEALEMRAVAQERMVPLVMPGAGANAITGEKCSPYVIRVSYANEQLAAPLGTWVAAQRVSKRVYMMAAENISGRDMLADFGTAFTAGGGEIVGQSLVPDGVSDFTPHLAKLRLTGADGVFAFFMDKAAQAFVTAWNEMGMGGSVRLLAPGMLLSPLEPTSRPVGLLGALYYLSEVDVGTNPAFVQDFATRFGHLPSEWAAQGYDSVKLVVEALAVLGGRTDDRQALARALAGARFAGARGKLRIDPRTRNVVQDIYIVETRRADSGLGYVVMDRLPEVAVDPAACKS